MRVNHGFIAARRRLYGKHVRGLSLVTARRAIASASASARARARARDGPYFSSPKCRRGKFQHRYNITVLFTLGDLSRCRDSSSFCVCAPLSSGVAARLKNKFRRASDRLATSLASQSWRLSRARALCLRERERERERESERERAISHCAIGV